MATWQDALLELEARGELDEKQQSALTELRNRGQIMSAQEYGIRSGRPAPDYARTMTETQDLVNLYSDPFGLRDEFVGAGQAARRFVTSGFDVGEAGEAYSDAAEYMRARQRVAREKHGAGIVPDIVSGFGTSGLGKNALRAIPGFWNSAKEMAKTGAQYGTVAGIGHSEGGPVERALGGLYGGATGAVVSPVIGKVIAPSALGIVRGLRNAGAKTRDVFGDVVPGWRRGLYQRLGRQMERQGDTPASIQARLDRTQELSTYGKSKVDTPYTIADTGKAMRNMTRTLEAMPGRAATKTERFLERRQRGSAPWVPKGQRKSSLYDRVTEHFARNMRVFRGGDYAKNKHKLIESRKKAAEPYYQRFRNLRDQNGSPVRISVGRILRNSERMDVHLDPDQARLMARARAKFIARPVLRDMSPNINNEIRVGQEAIAGRQQTTRLSTRRFDYAKRGLDDMIATERDRGNTTNVALLTQLKNELVAAADKASMRPVMTKYSYDAFDSKGNKVTKSYYAPKVDPLTKQTEMESVYAKARDAYETPSGMLDALRDGRTFMKGDSEVTAMEYKAMSSAEKRMFRIGMVRQARQDLGKKASGSDLTSYFDRPNVQEVLRETMGPKAFKRFYQALEPEIGMVQSRRATQNSVTAKLQADMRDFNLFQRFAQDVRSKGLVSTLYDNAAEFLMNRLAMREADARAMARVLFETDPVKQRAYLQEVEKVYGRGFVRRNLKGWLGQTMFGGRLNPAELGASQRLLGAVAGETKGRRSAIRPRAPINALSSPNDPAYP